MSEHLNDDSVHYGIVIQFISSQDIDIGGRPRWIWGVWGDLHSPDSQQLRGQGAYYYVVTSYSVQPVALLGTAYTPRILPQKERQLARERKRAFRLVWTRHVQAPIQGRSIRYL